MISKIIVKHKTKVKRSTKWAFLARKIHLKNDISNDTWTRFGQDSWHCFREGFLSDKIQLSHKRKNLSKIEDVVSFPHEATMSNMFKRNSRVSTNNLLRQHDAEVTSTAIEIHCELVWKLYLLLNRQLKPWRDGNSWLVAMIAFPSQLRKLCTREDIGQKAFTLTKQLHIKIKLFCIRHIPKENCKS